MPDLLLTRQTLPGSGSLNLLMYRPALHGLILLLSSISLPAAATAVHRWIDADGVTHFSDTLPTDRMIHVATVELFNFPPLIGAQNDYYSIVNQWQRMREERETKNKIRLEKAKIRALKSAAVSNSGATAAQDYAGTRSYPVYIRPANHYRDYSRAASHGEGMYSVTRALHHVKAHGSHVTRVNPRSRISFDHNSASRSDRRKELPVASGLKIGINLH